MSKPPPSLHDRYIKDRWSRWREFIAEARTLLSENWLYAYAIGVAGAAACLLSYSVIRGREFADLLAVESLLLILLLGTVLPAALFLMWLLLIFFSTVFGARETPEQADRERKFHDWYDGKDL